MELEKLLQKHFGYRSFKPGQEEVISSILSGRHTLAMLPTGTGKSLCYQLPGYLLSGTVIIISPLLSLMQDQVEQMMRFGEKRVVGLNSFLTAMEKKEVVRHLGRYKFIFLSPEMLNADFMIQSLKQLSISLFVVDEAHCISQWGYDFRPDYQKLGEIRNKLGNPLTLALTATATKKVRDDIIRSLDLKEVYKVETTVDRPNIAFYIEKLATYQEKQIRLLEHARSLEKPGIIYFSSKKAAEQTAALLKEKGINRVMAYHGGMDQEQRILIQQQFINDQLDLICATSAFGMGVNKENIRFIIHYHMPLQMESYLQEVGRAGRDGKPSIAILLNSPGDEQLPFQLAQTELPSEQQIDWLFHRLQIDEMEDENSFSLDGSLQSLGGFTEVQWRIVEEFAGRLVGSKGDIKKIKFQLKEYINQRLTIKKDNIVKVLKWIESNQCRRDYILEYFEESLNRQNPQCCDRCGIDLLQYEAKGTEKPVEIIQEQWKEYLSKILLLQENL